MEAVVSEGGMSFGLDFAAGYSAGLFIDQRANRALVRRLGKGKVLNTFAYTCSFSVAAAIGGAQTTSVDLSKKSIARGQENFRFNQLRPDQEWGHRFYSDDVLDVMPWLVRRKESFDVVILDPPTFSRGNGGRRFQVETGLDELMRLALELAAPNAKILLSSNCTRMNRRALEAVARFALKAARRAGDLHGENPLPDVPEALGAQTLWVFLRG
jgi:23S rRNA (cytosine1962-C5)-methyltransferase